MKRNVLAGFKDVLLLPVTIVPRTVSFGVNALVAGSNTAVSGLAMLNPQKWAGNTGARVIKEGNQEVVFDIPKEIEEVKEKQAQEMNEKQSSSTIESATSIPGTPKPGQIKTRQSGEDGFDRLQLLVSLDTALELIQADRDSLKRCETLAKYPGKNGVKVKEAIEEIFILLLKAVGDRHIAPGFRVYVPSMTGLMGRATSQMMTYTPADHESSTSVAPLLQFFELVHVGDTIQSMVQVYFDKELVSYVDKTDFLNAVMREKKRFEGILDDAVAGGLNAGIEVLMNQVSRTRRLPIGLSSWQVEHIIITKTAPREYCPDESTPLELGPTEGCREAIKCLEMHCDLLRGSTSKEVLEVFYQEVGIRLQQYVQYSAR
jgi:recyclin-1